MKNSGFKSLILAAGLFLIVPGTIVQGQKNSFAEQVRKAYGPSQKLVNGTQYYNRYGHVQNHPYFLFDDFASGNVIINGQEFPGVRIRYNLYTQHLELEYETFTEAANSLVMISEQVDGFTLGEYRFERLELDGKPQFYQVIETEAFNCYVHRGMDLVLMDQGFFYDELFKELDTRFLLRMNGDIISFTNRKSFLKCFPESRQKEIRRHLRQQQFGFKDASPVEISRRMHEVSAILNSHTIP